VSEAPASERDADEAPADAEEPSGDDAAAAAPEGDAPEAKADGEVVIEVDGLTKYYREHAAVRGVSFAIRRGEVVGFLGPNGAGKSTTMRMLTGAIPATRGAGRIAGFDVFEQPLEVKRRVGYLPEIPPVYTDLTVRDQLKFGASLKGLKGAAARKTIEASIERCQLHEHVDRLVGALSKGFRQRVGLAQALLGDPDVLILDEPTVGLDPRQIQIVRGLIQDLAGGHTIILSTHILQEVSMVCGRVIIIRRGEIVVDEPLEGLSSRHEGRSLEEVFLEKVEEDA
jgi:ABC-2 type transport system ATP-binding protein